MSFLKKLYEKRLEKNVINGKVPEHIMIVADEIEFLENISKFSNFIEWCRKFGINQITICIHMFHPLSSEMLDKITSKLYKSDGVKIRVFTEDIVTSEPPNGFTINLIAGYGGRKEITDAVKKLAGLVEEGHISPENISEKDIERFLRIKEPPDLVMRAGEEIPDFLIWQNIYSELYFLDVDWKSFRYMDFLRCLREYQRRERRYGQ